MVWCPLMKRRQDVLHVLGDPSRDARDARNARNGLALSWSGRTWRPDEVVESPRAPRSGSPRVLEITGDGSHRLVHGEALSFARALASEGFAGKVDLVYVDPPYASARDYVAEARLDGSADGRVTRTPAYEDTWAARDGGLGAYLDMLAPSIEALVKLLSPKGTIWVHLDWRAAYLVRVVLDEIMGRDAFKNEIVWRRAPNLGRQAASGQFGRTLDTIVVYGNEKATLTPPTRLEPIEPSAIRWDEEKRPFTSAPRGDYTDASIAKLDKEGRVHRTSTGKVYIKYFLVKNEDGVLCRERRVDALWTDVAPLRHAVVSERTGYPTQKPRALLERIIQSATSPGSIVVDAFSGSGTTGVAAHATGRRAFLADQSMVAIATSRARMLREGAGLCIERSQDMASPSPSPLRVKVETSSKAKGNGKPKVTTVKLLEPKEPLAWAVGFEELGVFRCAWHSERVPGRKPVIAASEASVDGGKDLVVRVWSDDGGVTTSEEIRS